ncbi:uncharacterized protein M6B38_276330 [Iris pallida]|uniref:Uncharacterized protein n=1 Tax=Iris pallida TaxID=29817 RepID=A0AAX6I333_IRIPA|nr:uncharacterized protein M6B38_276330 [Iris pallida]
MLPVPVQSWTLWLQWDPLYLSAVQVIKASTFSDHFISCLELFSCFKLLYLILSRWSHGLVLYGSFHEMLSPSGASDTTCFVRFTNHHVSPCFF